MDGLAGLVDRLVRLDEQQHSIFDLDGRAAGLGDFVDLNFDLIQARFELRDQELYAGRTVHPGGDGTHRDPPVEQGQPHVARRQPVSFEQRDRDPLRVSRPERARNDGNRSCPAPSSEQPPPWALS